MKRNGHSTILENVPFGMTISNIITFFRPSEWIDKIQMNIGAAFILILDLFHNGYQNVSDIFILISIFIIYQFFLACYGYAINAYSDRKIDSMVGKYKGVSYFTRNQLSIFMIFLSIGCLGIPLLLGDLRIIILGILAFILATGYSLEPLRFKNKGFVGIIGATLPQRPLMILFFALLVNTESELVVILMGWTFFIGIIMEIGHQMLDFNNDKMSQANTWIVHTESQRVKKYTFLSLILLLIFLVIPIFTYPLEIGITFTLIILAFSGHSIFYFIDGWKAYRTNFIYH